MERETEDYQRRFRKSGWGIGEVFKLKQGCYE